MTSTALLRTYRTIRDILAEIQQTAAAVEEHVGRFQIFGTREEIGQAVAEAEGLGAKIQDLELHLGRCARKADAMTEVHGSFHSSSELWPAGVP